MNVHTICKSILPILAATVMLAGCAVLQPAVEVPEMKLASEMPPHARQVADAMVMRLTGATEQAVASRTGVAGSGLVQGEKGVTYQGFTARQIKFRDHISTAYEPHLHQVQGYIHLADTSARNASFSFAARYMVKNGRPVLDDGIVVPLFSQTPAVELFALPLSRLKAIPAAAADDYGRFYNAVAEASLALRNPGAVPSGTGDYALVLFAKDRIGPGAELAFWPSHTSERVDGKIVGDKSAASYRYYDSGWQVGVIPATFSPAGGEALWVKAVVSRKGVGGGSSVSQVGLFACQAMAPAAGEKAPAGHPNSAINKAPLPEVRVVARQ